MGADGGVKLQRKDLVRHAKHSSKEDQVTAAEYNKHGRWQTCFLSHNPLRVPIVSDYQGRLYNKEAILELLVDPEAFTEKQRELVPYIRSLKDVVELKISQKNTQFICPITENVLGTGGVKYIYLVKCHCVFAEKCLREISAKDNKLCPLCNEPYENEDVIVINPNEKDLKPLEDRMKLLEAKGLPHSLTEKKLKKKRKHKDGGPVLTKKQHN